MTAKPYGPTAADGSTYATLTDGVGNLVTALAPTGAAGGALNGTYPNPALADAVQTTIKGRALGAGTGAPTDLTAAQAAAIIGSVGGALNSKVISTTKDMTQASGNVSYTGFGFQPTAVFAMATGTISGFTQFISLMGFADSAKASASFFIFGSTPTLGANFITLVDATVTNNQNATVASYDADGITLTWTKTGAPTGTATIKLIAFR